MASKYKILNVDDILRAGGIEKYIKKHKIQSGRLLMTTTIKLTKKEYDATTEVLKKD